MNSATIYAISDSEGIFYVGSTDRSLERMNEQGCAHSLLEVVPVEERWRAEQRWINKLRSTGLLANGSAHDIIRQWVTKQTPSLD